MQSFEELISIVKKLRGENGCAWDKVQTFDSLIPCFLEESYEVVDGISKRDYKNIKEELGDVLLHIVFFSELANDENKFNIDEVIKNINEKLIRRHPHVFGESNIKDVDGILKQWDEIKKERAKNHFEEFKLNELYSPYAAEESIECLGRIKRLFKKGGQELAMDELQEDIRTIKEHAMNSWKVAMYQAIRDSSWFWEIYLPNEIKNREC